MAAVVEWRYANLGQYIDERKLEIMLLEKTRGIPILQMHDFRITVSMSKSSKKGTN